MDTNTIEQLKTIMQPIADKIGQSAQFGWEVVLKQQYVYATEGLLCFILGLILIPVMIKVVKHAKKEAEKDPYSAWDVGQVLVPIVGGFLIIVLVTSGAETAITHFLNPAYYAIDFFIHLVK